MPLAAALDVAWAPLRWEGELPANLLTAVSPEAFRRAVATHRLVVADFWVPWCNGCRRLYPKLKQIAANNPEVTFLSVRLPPRRSSAFLPRLRCLASGRPAVHMAAAERRVCGAGRAARCGGLAGGLFTWPRLQRPTAPAVADPAAPGAPQVNGADAALTDFVASDLGVDRLPFFHLYRCGELRAGFAANLSKLAQLRAEIAFLKACSEPACSV